MYHWSASPFIIEHRIISSVKEALLIHHYCLHNTFILYYICGLKNCRDFSKIMGLSSDF